MRKSGGKIIERKGATFYAVAISVCHIVKCIFTGAETTMTVSTMMHGEYGVEDVCLSSLCIVGKEGIAGKIVAPLTPEEEDKFRHSAKCLRDVIDSLEF